MLGAMAHADALECFGHALLSFARIHAAIGQRQLDVFINGQVANQIETLKDETHFAIANARALRERKIFHSVTVEDVLAVGRRVEQAEDRQQGRLAASRRPGNRKIFSLL